MKTRHPLTLKFASFLSLAFYLASGMVGAQTSYYYSSGSGATAPSGAIANGTLADIGFDAYQTNTYDPFTHGDGGGMSAAADGFGGYFYHNYTLPGLPSTLGDGSTLASVTFVMFAESVSPGYQTTEFQVYDGLSGSGNLVSLLFLSHPDNELEYFSFTVSASVLAGGFSVGTSFSNALLNVSTEENIISSQTPLVVANYNAVPEPSAALLGGVAALGFFRRRRVA